MINLSRVLPTILMLSAVAVAVGLISNHTVVIACESVETEMQCAARAAKLAK